MRIDLTRVITLAALAVALVLPLSAASEPFIFSGEPVHPGCVHAVAMQPGDVVPVTTSVSLEGCAASERSKAPLKFDKDIIYIEDEKLTGSGSFGYRHLSTLDNGLFVVGIRRVDAEGSVQVSLAAMGIRKRPTLQRGGQVGDRLVLEMVGEVRLPDMRMASLRVLGNRVQYSAGAGTSRVDGSVDLSRIGRALR
ncbi:MAG: hypothetical protein JRG96_13015 [Deltaproteobacteria bacterium]|nr:hypothetical protein [Deltaproteobacteria bacterium]MBW2420214.1 hypothetical protein [Deltaproteobacteria bacterium]